MGFGLPGGRFTIGPTSMQANADAGLPFADVPGDLAGQVEAVLEHEPTTPIRSSTSRTAVGTGGPSDCAPSCAPTSAGWP